MIDRSSSEWRFGALTRETLRAMAPDATLVLPLGSTEQHGRHLPVSVDTAVVTALAERAVEQAATVVPVLLAPTLPFGFADHHLAFGGTLSIGTLTYIDLLCDLATGLAEEGFRRLVFLNGHGGNESAMRLATDRIAYEIKLDLHVAAASYWALAADLLDRLDLDQPVPGHAGHFETSLMLAIAPELVVLDDRPHDLVPRTRLGANDLEAGALRRPGIWESSDGRTDDARLASIELGERLVTELSAVISDFLVRFHHSVPSEAEAETRVDLRHPLGKPTSGRRTEGNAAT